MWNYTKWHLTHEIFRILFVFSQFLWNLTFIFSDSYNKFSLVLLQMTNYIFSPWKNVKKNALFFKLFWYKVLVHWKLKLLNFLEDSVLIINNVHMYVFYFWYCARQVAKINIEQFQWPCLSLHALKQWCILL